jgi:hypothetical protein
MLVDTETMHDMNLVMNVLIFITSGILVPFKYDLTTGIPLSLTQVLRLLTQHKHSKMQKQDIPRMCRGCKIQNQKWSHRNNGNVETARKEQR